MLSPRTPLITLLSVSLVLACNTRSRNPADRNSGYLATIQCTFGNRTQTDSLAYDSLHRLVRFCRIGNETVTADFSYAGNSDSLVSYALNNPQKKGPVIHRLSYDAQNRIIKDTTFPGGPWVYYRYSGDSILIAGASKTGDTLVSKNNGNLLVILTPDYRKDMELSIGANPAYYIPNAAVRLLLYEMAGGCYPNWLSNRGVTVLNIVSPGNAGFPDGQAGYHFACDLDTSLKITRLYDNGSHHPKCDIRFTYY
ncbi:hypothetical protein [Dinghuibacter silviterrae]|uniref:Uncharacterized protein n=1 Tax=Dinghuibacter silviterrae TaxID=1539049 RepID=A0A4R8DN76_9BACT|nr:hypothetical protein [Dinghuibacter silviterrae]TDW99471.1 hypothetical protein EDB95_0481 [Dinghuibacter silviterrae]